MSERPVHWRQSGLVWWPLGVGLLALDQITKEIIQRVLALHEAIYVLPVLDILHTRNTGAAFSFLAGAGGWQRWAFTIFAVAVTVGIVVALRRTAARSQRLLCAGLALIASGALGNAIDRLRHGFVVDFVAVHWNAAYFPAFNVADACITVGAGLILLDALVEWQRERKLARGQAQ
jgi:signal peptidase II